MTPEIEDALARIRAGTPYESHPVRITHCRINDRPVSFATDMERDPVQRNHRAGRFYETRELAVIARRIPRDATVIDIGANAGNHALFLALFAGARRIIPVEPNPLAYRLLIQNVLLNGVADRFDLTRLGIGVSDRDGEGFGMEIRDRNLGAARMLEGEGGIAVHRADTLFADETPDFVKIDVEGMEMEVLSGAEGLISRTRPMLFVEVAAANTGAFDDWAARMGYREIRRWGDGMTNRLLRPV